MAKSADMKKATMPLHGIGGWLTLLIFLLMFSPFIYAGQIIKDLGEVVKANPHVAGTDIFMAVSSLMWLACGVVSACKVTAGISLWKFRTPRAVRVAIIMMWAAFLADLIFVVLIAFVVKMTVWSLISDSPGTYIGTALSAGVWTWYLCVSRRVRNTYYAVDEAIHASPLQDAKQAVLKP